MDDRTIESLSVGDYCVLKRTFSKKDFNEFRKLSGDSNPLHHDRAYAEKTSFGSCIVPLFLAASQFSAIAGEYLPGHRSLIMRNNLVARGPIFYDEEITFSAQIVSKSVPLQSIELRILGFVEREAITVVLEGEMLVKVRVDPSSVEATRQTQGEVHSKHRDTVVIVGATSEIGESVAKRYAKEDRDLVLVYFSDQSKASRLKKDLSSITNVSIKKFSSLRKSKFLTLQNQGWSGDLDTVVYALSSPLGASLGEMMESNYVALREITEAVLPGMLARQRGRIISIGSGAIVNPVSGLDDYVAAKTAAAGYLQGIGKEFGPYGITTTVFSPDAMRTTFSNGLKFSEESRMLPEHAAEQLVALAIDNDWKGGFVWSRINQCIKGDFGFFPQNTENREWAQSLLQKEESTQAIDKAREPQNFSVADEKFGDVVEKVKLIAARILAFDTSRITGDSGIGFTPGWDSLKQIEILLAVEHEFDIRFVSVEFSELTTVSRISETVVNLSQH